MKRTHLYALTAALSLLGAGLFLYKWLVLGFPVRPHAKSAVWNVEASVTFKTKGKPTKVVLYVPRSDGTTLVTDENFVSAGFGFTSIVRGVNRQATWSVREAVGRQTVLYRAVVRKLEDKDPRFALPPAKRQASQVGEPEKMVLGLLVKELNQRSADSETFVRQLLRRLNDLTPEENVRVLLGETPTEVRKLEVASLVLEEAKIPARIAHGIELRDQLRHVPIEHWLEVYDEGQWSRYRSRESSAKEDASYLVWWRGNGSLVDVRGADLSSVELSVLKREEQAMEAALLHTAATRRAFIDYSLLSLPLRTQAVYPVPLLIPVGALIVVLFRNLIGVNTFGTFMPVLIALAFRETEVIKGVIYFTIIVAVGLSVRFYLEYLKLLFIPRLAVTLSVVVILMGTLSVITYRLGLEHGLSVALFPMVILAITIERMSIVWEEQGAGEALLQAVGTIVVASCIYAVLSEENLQHVVFFFPEILLPLVALMIILGRYTGYRLSELRRFQALSKELS